MIAATIQIVTYPLEPQVNITTLIRPIRSQADSVNGADPVYNLCLGPAQQTLDSDQAARKSIWNPRTPHTNVAVVDGPFVLFTNRTNQLSVHIFEVQGHHEPDDSKDGHNEVVMFLTLNASYDFIPQPPPFLGEALK